jgi:hypothetical protein
MTEIAFLENGSLKVPTPEELKDADGDARIICLLTGATDDGGDGWAFVAILPSLYPGFQTKCKAGEGLMPEEFGEVIAHGKGVPPPSDVVKRMQSRYGFDPHFSERLIEEAKKQQTAFFKQQETLRIKAAVATLKKQNAYNNPRKDPNVF